MVRQLWPKRGAYAKSDRETRARRFLRNLERTKGNMAEAARRSDISISTIRLWLKSYPKFKKEVDRTIRKSKDRTYSNKYK